MNTFNVKNRVNVKCEVQGHVKVLNVRATKLENSGQRPRVRISRVGVKIGPSQPKLPGLGLT